MTHARMLRRCPGCGAEWEEIGERSRDGPGVLYACGNEVLVSRVYPLRRGFCRACAAEGAPPEDRARYIREADLIYDFCGWLFDSAALPVTRPSYVADVYGLIERRDPELMDSMTRQYIEDRRQEDFAAWRFGEGRE